MSDQALAGFEPPKMNWNLDTDLPTRFKRFRQRCNLLFDGPLNKRTIEQKCNYLLLWSGDHGIDLYNTWELNDEQKKDINEYWRRFESHVEPQANYILNRYYIRSLQQNDRSLTDFLTEARLLIQNCNYPADLNDQLMRDTLVFGTKSEIVRKKCITEGNNLTFARAQEIARTEEATRLQLQAMKDKPQGSREVDSIKDHNQNGKRNNYKPSFQRHDTGRRTPRGEHNRNNAFHKQSTKQCQRCGHPNHTNQKQCPATGVECFHCHKIGHFSKMCRSKTNLNEIQGRENNAFTSSVSDNTGSVFLGTIETENNINSQRSTPNSVNQKQRRTKVLTSIQVTTQSYHIRTTELICKVDTGAEINVISKKDFDRFLARPANRM